MDEPKLKILFSEKEIEDRVKRIAEEINAAYAGEELLVICILKGAFMFFSDLIRRLDMDPLVDFMKVASYGNDVTSSYDIRFTKDVELPLAGRHVLLVEDIVDSGYTIKFLRDHLKTRGAKSLRVAALIDKVGRREVEVEVDFYGFKLNDGFVVGYGIDYAEHYRSLPAIYLPEVQG